MAQLRAILDTVDDDTATRAGLHDSFAALSEVQRHDPRVVAGLLGGPQVGAWAAKCLRRPLWTDVMHLGAIAAVAALRTGRRVRVVVPVRTGAVHLPGFGRAFVAGAGERAECVTGQTGLLLNGTEPAGWEPVRVLRAFAGGVALRVQLDDLDPYWSVFGMPTVRLTGDEVELWGSRLAEAWVLLAERQPHRLATMAAAIRCLVPIQRAGLGGSSASSVDAPGAVALTEPVSPPRLAATLVHESQHYRLATLHDLKPLYKTPSARLRYSPWRNDPRPLSGVLHGVMAFTGVADFWSRDRTGPAAELEYARLVRQVRSARRGATTSPELTPLGENVLAALGAAMVELPGETRQPDILRLADDLVAEHAARWCLRNVVPRQDDVRAFRDAWMSGATLPTTHTAGPTASESSGDNPLTRLAMAWLENPAEVRALAADTSFTTRFPGATPRDVSLMAGDHRAARDEALAGIAAGATDDRTWATLAVAHERFCAKPSRSPVGRVPELVRAAFAELSPDHDLDPLLALMARYEDPT